MYILDNKLNKNAMAKIEGGRGTTAHVNALLGRIKLLNQSILDDAILRKVPQPGEIYFTPPAIMRTRRA